MRAANDAAAPVALQASDDEDGRLLSEPDKSQKGEPSKSESSSVFLGVVSCLALLLLVVAYLNYTPKAAAPERPFKAEPFDVILAKAGKRALGGGF